ncbi:cupin domain-containing protein [Natronobiforma cellulositropha]|uniref:cupin domain-containing protein n=1 Tax=Natronobiforma cellulositropha TaxID=1679076 RepID=UPI0021D5901F|nr:cupin domain-containing protein [Natronobiforma cellulositropha]
MTSTQSAETDAVDSTERVTLTDLEGTPHARVFEGEPQTIRLTLAAGDSIAPHQHPDRQIVLHLLEGSLAVTLGENEHELEAGEVVRFDGDQYVSPTALEDSVALLVLAPRADAEE